MIQPAGNSFFKGLALTISPCTKWPAKIPRAHRPRARFPPQLPRLVIFNCSARLPTMSINAVPTSPPIIDHNRNSVRFPPKATFPPWVCCFAAKVKPRNMLHHIPLLFCGPFLRDCIPSACVSGVFLSTRLNGLWFTPYHRTPRAYARRFTL